MTCLRFRLRPTYLGLLAMAVALSRIVPSIPGLLIEDPERRSPTGWLGVLLLIAIVPLVGTEPVRDLAIQAPGGSARSRVAGVGAAGAIATVTCLALAAAAPTGSTAASIAFGGLMWAGPAVLCVGLSPRVAPLVGSAAFAATMVLGLEPGANGTDGPAGRALVAHPWALPLRDDLFELSPLVALCAAVALLLLLIGRPLAQRRGNSRRSV